MATNTRAAPGRVRAACIGTTVGRRQPGWAARNTRPAWLPEPTSSGQRPASFSPRAAPVRFQKNHRVVARSLPAYLESFDGLKVVGIASSGEELLDHLDEWRPRIILQELLLPGGIDGIETTRRILERDPSIRVIALTASTDEARMMGVLRAGAVGYVRKDADPEILLDAVRAVARGKTYIDPHIAQQVLRTPAAQGDLIARELDVLRKLALGSSNKEIAEALFISEETVKTYLGHLFPKLEVENRAQAIVQALKRGLVSLEELE